MDEALLAAAMAGRERAYAPYSGYKVGASVATAAGVFGGCNVENASYGLCNCAERTALFAAIAAGATRVLSVAVITDDGGSPCGACRQVIAEFADDTCDIFLLNGAGGIVHATTLGDLLPRAFRLPR